MTRATTSGVRQSTPASTPGSCVTTLWFNTGDSGRRICNCVYYGGLEPRRTPHHGTADQSTTFPSHSSSSVKVVIVMPAFNVARTLEKTYWAIPAALRAHVV